MYKDNLMYLRATIDLLAVALTEHGHKWTIEEREGYEKAISIIRDELRYRMVVELRKSLEN